MNHLVSKKNRTLLRELVRTDFKLRYQGSILGYTWSLLRPLLMFVILYIVFVKFLKIGKGVEHYPVYLLLGIVLWGFFTEMTSQSLGSIVGRGDLIRKIKIPRWIIVISSSVSALINLFLNLIIIVIFIILNKVDLHPSALLLPLSLIELYLFSLGVSFFLAAAYVKFRDISYIWEVVLQAGFYATPILYPLTLVPNITFQKILLLNPIAQAVQGARFNVVTTQTVTSSTLSDNTVYILIPVIITLVTLLIGGLYFKKESKYFAENI
ncbi:ABC transporter permease [Candidatus Nomurabacteria bacterium]|nr:ABC transporter permease [Candidatus Nomurabacteria bacterium]